MIRPYVAICVPCFDYVRSEFLFNFTGLMYSSQVRPAIIKGASSIVTVARDNCIEAMMTVEESMSQQMGRKFEMDYVFFLDSDILCPPQALNRLLAHDKDVVAATYVRRTPPYDVMVATLDNEPLEVDTGLVEVAAVPTGCLLLRRDIFHKLKKPYFRLIHDEETQRTYGEDVTLCKMLRSLGYSIWLDVDLTKELLHIADQPLGPEVSDTGKMRMVSLNNRALLDRSNGHAETRAN